MQSYIDWNKENRPDLLEKYPVENLKAVSGAMLTTINNTSRDTTYSLLKKYNDFKIMVGCGYERIKNKISGHSFNSLSKSIHI